MCTRNKAREFGRPYKKDLSWFNENNYGVNEVMQGQMYSNVYPL